MKTFYEDDVGITHRFTCYLNGSVMTNLDSVTEKTLLYTSPSKETVERTASFYTDGTDGKLKYVILETDFEEVGIWSVQARIKWSDIGPVFTDKEYFLVLQNSEV